jgi:hypothetical protein
MFDIALIQTILEKVGNTQDPVAKNIIKIEEKQIIVQDILQELENDTISSEGKDLGLELLRVLCREPSGSEPFFSEKV